MVRRMNLRAEAVLGWTLALALAAGFCGLGFWQLGRAQYKKSILAETAQILEKRMPQSLSLAADESRLREYDWVPGTGEFADTPAVLLDNQMHEGRAGVRAYRLFVPEGSPPLLVELGWLSLPPDRRMPEIARPLGIMRVSGLLSPPPSSGIVRTAAEVTGDAVLVTNLSYAAQWGALGVERLPPRVLRLDPAMTGIGYARDLDVLPNTMPPARHVAYAVQWFGLALAVLATAAVLTFRRRRAGRAKMPA